MDCITCEKLDWNRRTNIKFCTKGVKLATHSDTPQPAFGKCDFFRQAEITLEQALD